MQRTRDSKSFIEVLEAEIRADLRKEIEAEVQARYGRTPGVICEQAPSAAVHAAGRLETWLASHVGPITFARTAGARKVYGAPAKCAAAILPMSPKIEVDSCFFTVTTATEFFAVEILNRQSPLKLTPTFTEENLKSVWRKAALKTHPDRFTGADEITQTRMTVLFRELVEAYETLINLVESKKAD